MIDPKDVPLEEKLKVIKIYRQMMANMLNAVIRPEHIETMRRLQRVELETQRLREAAAAAARESGGGNREDRGSRARAGTSTTGRRTAVHGRRRDPRAAGRRQGETMTESEMQQLWDTAMAESRERLLRRADGFEMLAAAPGQTPREIVECQKKALELREAANWRMPE